MAKKQLRGLTELKEIWNKYRDTVWIIEQNWEKTTGSYQERLRLTKKTLELIKIEKKLKSLEKSLKAKYTGSHE